MATIWIIFLLIQTYSCENIENLFKEVNEIATKYNAIGANIAWQSSIDPANPSLPSIAAVYQQKKINWQQNKCRILDKLHDRKFLNLTQERQAYLLCRGPSYTYNEAREVSTLYEELQSIYAKSAVCISNIETNAGNITAIEEAITNYISNVQSYLISNTDAVHIAAKLAANDFKKDGLCLKREEDFEKVMKTSRKPEVLEWVWLVWRELMKPMRAVYQKLADVENKAARRNGYTDIGASWRDELEIPNLRETCHRLYDEIKPLYALLHGVVRFTLRRHYGSVVPERGPIPAHLLGNLWSQNWEPLIDLILQNKINLDDRMKKLNWTVKDMVKKAEDFYMSLELPPMTATFWRESVFTRENRSLARCHGTAADMFENGDFRLLFCSEVSFEDFYVVHHEMGHLQYYMAYENQPGLFRQANAALHETIGDTIMQAVLTPHHLQRLRLINDSELYNTRVLDKELIKLDEFNDNNEIVEDTEEQNIDSIYTDVNIEDYDEHNKDRSIYCKHFEDFDKITTDDILILKQALNKLPQIPFSLLIDEYRWRYFEGSLDFDNLNKEFWAMAEDIQGITPGSLRGEEYFDIGAIFHVPDNTPYIRYFLSSFLQHQLYESLCKASVFGHRNIKDPLPSSIHLNRCDIYGSKSAGRILKDLMSRGHSQHWRQIMQETLGQDEITSSALQRYYRPLYVLLMKLVKKYNIPIGW